MKNNQNSPFGIASLANLLKQVELGLDVEEIVDLLWLAVQMGEVSMNSLPKLSVEEPQNPKIDPDKSKSETANSKTEEILDEDDEEKSSSKINHPVISTRETTSKSIPLKVPTGPGLRQSLKLARALRPLMRKVPSRTNMILDEEETVNQICEKKTWTTVLKPQQERWLDLALVIEESSSTPIWEGIIKEFKKLIELQGAFRHTRTWYLKTDKQGSIKLFPQQNQFTFEQRPRSPKELLDPTGRRLILLISDCTSSLWGEVEIYKFLQIWSASNPLAIVQLLPERLWTKTAMGYGFPVNLSASAPGVPNNKLLVDGLPVWEDINIADAITSPVVTLEPNYLNQWSRVLAGVGSVQTAGILFENFYINNQAKYLEEKNQLSPEELVQKFRVTASPTARRLAGLMALVPVSLPVVHLIQETLVKESMQVHVAEVFMSGLLEPVSSEDTTSKGEIVQYDFIEGVRELLVVSVPTPDVDEVLEEVSRYIARKVGLSIKSFEALLVLNPDWSEETRQNISPFAKVSQDVLQRLGGKYADIAEKINEISTVTQSSTFTEQKTSTQSSTSTKPSKSAEEYSKLAMEFEDEQDYVKALENIDEAIKIDPNNYDYLIAKGAILIKLGQMEEALELASSAIKIKPDNATLYKIRAQWHRDAGNYKAEIEDLAFAINLEAEKSSDYLEQIIESYYDLNDYKEILARINSAIESQPEEVDLYLIRGRLNLFSDNFAEALKDFDYVVQLQPEKRLGYHYRSLSHYVLESYDAAINDVLRAIELLGNGLDYYWLAIYYLATQDYDNALTYMNSSYELDKEDITTLVYTLLWRGVIYKLTGKSKESKEEWEQALQEAQKISDDINRLRTLALLAVLLQETKQAKEYYQQLLDQHLPLKNWLNARTYLKLILKLFSSRNDIQELYDWLEEKFT